MGWHQIKRWLYLTHRWVGIATCLLFVLWFVSGLVMLYVPFPSLDEDERLAGLAPIAWEQVEHGPDISSGTREVALEMRGNRPVWRISPWDGAPHALWAESGLAAGRADEAEARAIAERFGKAPLTAMTLIHSDQWSVPGSYDAHRPLWKATLAGGDGQVLYISSVTGEVVLDTNRPERFWNWLGSVPHWLYPRALREHQPVWRQVVMWASGPCILGAITGIWIGLMRIRPGRRRFKGGRITPYRGWMKWHHVSGLIGSVFLVLWIFSGWLSVDPFRLFASEGVTGQAQRAFAGSAPLPAPDLRQLAQSQPGAHRLVLLSAADMPIMRVQRPGADDRLLDTRTLAPILPDAARIRQAATRLVPGAPILAIDTLTRPDAYWYAVRGEVALPVLRVRYGDAAKTWVHIDPVSGELLGQSNARRRANRWMFDLLHRWDLNLLLDTYPARELLIWLMSLAGLISSATAVYLGWLRLRRPQAGTS